MDIIFAGQAVPAEVTKSLFLAGPSPRSVDVADWRQEALSVLEAIQFDGTVYIPIPEHRFYGNSGDAASWTYDGQIEWECQARHLADVIVFWVPRDIDRTRDDLGMPAFTTNVEFGEDLSSGRLVYGRPADAEKCRYLDKRCEMAGFPVHQTLTATLEAGVAKLGAGAMRKGGEVHVPLFIWETPQFQAWYRGMKTAGNRLDDAKLLYHFRTRSGLVFCYVLWVNVWVEAEQRHKSNEVVFSRKDVSSVVAYHRNRETGEVKLALVKEFRSPVNNVQGFVYELPSGSASEPDLDPRLNAHHELEEEAGLDIDDLERFRLVGERQIGATLSTHRSTVYAVELTDAELAQLQEACSQQKQFGVDDCERTYVTVVALKDLFTIPVDYAIIGMVYEALAG